MSTDQERKSFEAWARADTTLHMDRDVRGYADMTTELLWHAWQARAALAPECEPAEVRECLCADSPWLACKTCQAAGMCAKRKAEVLRLVDQMVSCATLAACGSSFSASRSYRCAFADYRAALVKLLGPNTEGQRRESAGPQSSVAPNQERNDE